MQRQTATSTALLEGLKDHENRTIWAQYVDRYRPLIVAFCARLGLAEADAEDVAQEALIAFARRYREGRYDPARGRLRAWLYGIANAELLRWRRAHGRRLEVQIAASDSATDLFAAQPDADRLSALWEEEWRKAVVRQCIAEVRDEVGERTFAAFELFACEGWPARRVAEKLGTSESAVFVAKHRVLRRMRELHPRLEEVW
jgi:RNA polymerase sigma-70 factor (ECF subfamily)